MGMRTWGICDVYVCTSYWQSSRRVGSNILLPVRCLKQIQPIKAAAERGDGEQGTCKALSLKKGFKSFENTIRSSQFISDCVLSDAALESTISLTERIKGHFFALVSTYFIWGAKAPTQLAQGTNRTQTSGNNCQCSASMEQPHMKTRTGCNQCKAKNVKARSAYYYNTVFYNQLYIKGY